MSKVDITFADVRRSAPQPTVSTKAAVSAQPAPAAPSLRMTRQRNSVLEQVRSSQGFQSAQQIHAALAAAGVPIGLATVYRSLAALLAANEIDELKTSDGETLYRYCGTTKHHHHLVCRGCGKAEEISGPGLENFLAGVAKNHEFSNLEHVIEIWGTCAECA